MTATRASGAFLAAVLAASLCVLPHATASEPEPTSTATETATSEEAAVDEEPVAEVLIVPNLVFPVVGPASYADSFGDCRDGCTRAHAGNDIMTYGWKGVPVVAAHDGTVIATATDGATAGCSVAIENEDGWTTRYVHLNTDTPGTDVAGPTCFAPGIVRGVDVAAGTLLGWVGDSGNAEDTPPHLHFEIRDPEGNPVDPRPALQAADRIEYQLVTAAEIAGTVAQAYKPDTGLAYVVEPHDLMALAMRMDLVDIPIVPLDPYNPAAGHAALRTLAPERIVVFTEDPEARYVEDLRSLADFVEVAPLVDIVDADTDATVSLDESAPSAPARTVSEDPEPGAVHVVESEPHTLTLVLGRSWTVKRIDNDQPGPILILRSELRPPRSTGTNAPDVPGDEASRDGLWWHTADGWRRTESPDDAPTPTLALAEESDIAPWTVAYLTSQALAPPMPLWFYQPTSRATKSL